MRVHGLLLIAPLLAVPAPAQTSASDQIVHAFQLWSAGQPRAAIAILEPVLQSGGNGAEETNLGVAWNVLGSSYLDLEMYAKAEQAYQHAIEKLRPIASAQVQYASAIDNLGTLEESLRQNDSAKALCEKAQHIYELLGDSTGVAVASTNLAVIAYTENDFKASRRSLERAVEQAQHATALKDDDIAAMDTVKSSLALHDRRNEEAIAAIQQAIDRWTHAHGPGYFMLATGYLLRARAFAASGNYFRAIADGQQALAIAEATVGKNTVGYLTAETQYAQILRSSGAKQEAARLKKEAGAALAQLKLRLCNGCTINANGFR